MASLAGAAALAGGVYRVFDYNRDNFKYDREMRQKTEFKILEFRAAQAGQWREDIHDLIGLTERKMDN
jgi:lysyl-tRNA synthetase class II